MATLQNLADPVGIRPSLRRTDFGFANPIGIHPLSDGREAWVLWVYTSKTHVHVIVWVPGGSEFVTLENVARFNAAHQSELILQQFEV